MMITIEKPLQIRQNPAMTSISKYSAVKSREYIQLHTSLRV